MLLTPHVLSGMMFGNLSTNPAISTALGFLSYFILELIPHWDPEDRNKRMYYIIHAIDILVAILSAVVVLALKDFSIGVLLGGLAGALMYAIFEAISLNHKRNPVLEKLHYFKGIMKYSDKSGWGILIQLSVCIMAITIIFNLVDFPTANKIFEKLM